MIVLLHRATAFGAVERYAASIVQGLRGRDEDVVLVFPDVPELEPFARLGGGNVTASPLPPALISSPAPEVIWTLARWLRRLRPRIVHAVDVWAPALLAARLAGAPRVLLTHHTPELPRRDSLFGRLWWRLAWLTRPEVIYTSERDRNADARRRLKTHVVPLGIDLERFQVPRKPREGGPVIGNVARLAAQKGHRYLIEAAPLVLARYPGARFVIVGDGELAADLEEQARGAGLAERFELPGHREDVPECLASFDVFAFPSLFEGLCLAVIEAQAAGVPVVATPVGGIPENVVDGETGLLCPPRDPVALAAAIVRLLDHPEDAERMAARAQGLALARYSERRMVERTLELYA